MNIAGVLNSFCGGGRMEIGEVWQLNAFDCYSLSLKTSRKNDLAN